jgi:Zn-dependent protease with chaperone function
MRFVYFLMLPSALLSSHFVSYAGTEWTSDAYSSLSVSGQTLLNMWFVVGCFALASRWLEKAQQHLSFASVQTAEQGWISSAYLLRNRESLLLWIWCVLQPICLVCSGWTLWTQSILSQTNSQSLHFLLLLVPSILLLILVEAIRCSAFYRKRLTASNGLLKAAVYRREMTRVIVNTWLFPLCLPVAIAGLVDLGSLTNLTDTGHGLYGAVLFTLTTSSLVTLLIPHIFTRLIGAGSIDREIARMVEQSWRLGSNRVPTILHWPTGCRMANAAVVGLLSFGRKLLLTDALLQRLNDRELSMVVLHELAHCVRWHAWIRMVPTLVAVALLLSAMTLMSGVWLSLTCLLILCLFVVSLVSVCWWTEFDADRMALEYAIREYEKADRKIRLIEHGQNLCDALSKIYGSGNRKRASWMHPSCEQRIVAIRRLANDG